MTGAVGFTGRYCIRLVTVPLLPFNQFVDVRFVLTIN
jgi:hypothetical protein